MQRMLVIAAVIALVTVSLGVGLLAAHWPFWHRAWQWHASPTGWPATIEGSVRTIRAGDAAPVIAVRDDPVVAEVAGTASTQALLRSAGDGNVDAWFATGVDTQTLVDWRGLSDLVLLPLYAQLLGEHPDLLDAPVGASLPQWSEDRRGAITPRQLFWQLSGMPAGDFTPLNPFNARAQLAAGPDFRRTALRWQPVWPPGSHFEESPVNAQLLALVAANIDGVPFAEVLERRLWSRIAADDAIVMLDHRRGDMAAHCCIRASIGDWLRLAQQVISGGSSGAPSGKPGFDAQLAAASPVHEDYGFGFRMSTPGPDRQLLIAGTAGRQLLIETRTGTVLLWVGEGAAPPGLAQLLP